MKQKKLIAIFLALSCLVGFTGCKNDDTSNATNTQQVTNTDKKTASKEAENPFKKYKDKGMELYSDWYYLHARGITQFDNYRLEYLNAMLGKKDNKSYPMTKVGPDTFQLDSANPNPTYTFFGVLKDDMPSGYGDIYRNGKKICSAHFTNGKIDNHIILFNEEGRAYAEADISKVNNDDDTLSERTNHINNTIDHTPRILYFGSRTFVVDNNVQIQLDATMMIAYKVIFDDDTVKEQFYDNDGNLTAELRSTKAQFFNQLYTPIPLTEYYASGKVRYEGTGLTHMDPIKDVIYYTRDGQGKQFSEDGKVIYDGKWSNSECAQ